MRKEASLRQKTIKLFLVAAVSLFSLFGVSFVAHATSCSALDVDKFGSKTYCKNMIVEDIVAIPRTTVDFSTAGTVNVPSSILFNANPDQFGTCGAFQIAQRLSPAQRQVLRDGGGALVDDTTLTNAVAEEPSIGCDFNDSLYGSRVTGSLMGVTKYAYETIPNEPIPVSLASYYRYNLRKIPVIGNTAYAQEYGGWGLELALNLWTKTRNIAYAMMAVLMLVIGILIITRKRINPQTVVTVQTALPRVIISLFLITFSYPIGAVFASAIVPISVIVMKIFFSEILDQVGTMADMNQFVMINTLIALTLGGEGAIALLTMMALAAMTLVAMMAVLVKIVLINLKILLAIVFAPIQFAIASMPGQEELITKWFKQMIARVLAIPAMLFMMGLAWYILLKPFTDDNALMNIVAIGREPVATLGLTFFRRFAVSRVFTIIMLPLMCIFTMFTAIGVDKKVEGFIMGDTGKRSGGKK